jgi:hypothetical protein
VADLDLDEGASDSEMEGLALVAEADSLRGFENPVIAQMFVAGVRFGL